MRKLVAELGAGLLVAAVSLAIGAVIYYFKLLPEKQFSHWRCELCYLTDSGKPGENTDIDVRESPCACGGKMRSILKDKP